jgi:TolB-like protein/Flp pilus assembly protein TadD
MTDRADRRFYEFGRFSLDPTGRVLFRSNQAVPLPPKAAETLLLLVQNAGAVVAKEELLKRVWQDAFVEEGSLTRTISILRKALQASDKKHECIATVSKRGYRFVLPVKEIRAQQAPGERVMLAVLPFENLSCDRNQEYFSDGLTEEMITQLSRLHPERLGVIARTSAMQYKRTAKGIDQIARELRVDYIVEGAVRRDGSRVRITAQLIRADDQTHIWAHGYERHLQNVLLLQSELASGIAAEVGVQLVPQATAPAASGDEVNPEAYEACLKARFLWNRRTRDDLYRALEFFSKSIESDWDYAPGFAGLADTYLVLLDYRYVAPNEALPMATAAAVNALRLDQQLPDAHTSLAHAKFHALDWDGAEQEFRRALQLGPGYATAHFYYANFLTCRNRFEEAIAEAREAVRLDPVSMVAEANVAILYYNAGRYDEALESCHRALQMEPHLPRPYDDLGRILLEKGAFSEAITALEKAVSLANRGTRFLSSLGYGYGVSGRKDLACEILKELSETSTQRYVAPSDFAIVSAGLGEHDEAIRWLERACEERDSHVPGLNVDPRFAGLRTEPRFKALLKRLGLAS